MMRKRNNNRGGQRQGGHGGGGRRYHGGGGGHNSGGGRNDGQNLARQKHHAMQMREKYSNMARDAQINGDRPDVEYYLQHVDHYQRVLADIAVIEGERFAQQREQQQAQGGDGQPPQQGNDGGNGQGGGNNGGDMNAQEPIQQGHQPRMTRQHNNRPQQSQGGDDNGAQQANSNTNDIPLPSGILPAI